MAKRKKSELDFIKSFVDGAYSRLGNILYVDLDRNFDPQNSLGYCFKHVDPVNSRVIYQIVCAKIGIPYTDFRVMMHEYGHIYLGHLDGIHEELDAQIVDVFRDHRGELIEEINKKCGIDFADKLIERVIDDPVLNHSLHNIAMDMEVNSRVLSKDDIEEMELDITSVLPKYQEEALRYLRDHTDDATAKQEIDDVLKKMEKEAKIKLIVPERYHTGVDDQGNPIPFPAGRTYAEYLMMIIQNLDQFIKMLVSIQMGGNGDTSDITKDMIRDALQKQMQQHSDAYKQGYNDAQQDYANGTPGQQQRVMNGQDSGQQGQGQQGQDLGLQGSQPQQGQGQQQGQQGGNQQGQGGGQGNGQQGQQQGQGQGSGQGGQNPGQGQSPGGSGGSGMSGQDLQDYNQGYQDGMRDAANGQGGGSGMQGLSGLMSDMGMASDGSSSDSGDQGQDGQGGSGNGTNRYQGMRKDPTKDGRMDHRTPGRDEADQKRKVGKIRSAGGVGCGDSGGPDMEREVDKEVDEVEMALNEVMQNVKARVIKRETRRDVMKLYNRGIIRSVIAPSISQKVTVSVDPKVVYLIDISGSMDTMLVDRILKTIASNMKKLNRGLKYDIITWSTRLGEHIKDIDPRKGVPRISTGGGTSIASGMQYFKDHYGPEAILIVISDFEDYLEEWHRVEETMPEYTLYGFNYGDDRWNGGSDKIAWKNMKIKKFRSR
jgi:predicted metal-dependent peptidase